MRHPRQALTANLKTQDGCVDLYILFIVMPCLFIVRGGKNANRHERKKKKKTAKSVENKQMVSRNLIDQVASLDSFCSRVEALPRRVHVRLGIFNFNFLSKSPHLLIVLS